MFTVLNYWTDFIGTLLYFGGVLVNFCFQIGNGHTVSLIHFCFLKEIFFITFNFHKNFPNIEKKNLPLSGTRINY